MEHNVRFDNCADFGLFFDCTGSGISFVRYLLGQFDTMKEMTLGSFPNEPARIFSFAMLVIFWSFHLHLVNTTVILSLRPKLA